MLPDSCLFNPDYPNPFATNNPMSRPPLEVPSSPEHHKSEIWDPSRHYYVICTTKGAWAAAAAVGPRGGRGRGQGAGKWKGGIDWGGAHQVIIHSLKKLYKAPEDYTQPKEYTNRRRTIQSPNGVYKAIERLHKDSNILDKDPKY